MLKITILKLGQLETNCYLVADEQTSETVVIDPAAEADYIYQKISTLELKPTFVIATHGHFDHVLAVNELKLYYKIPFMMSKKDNFLLGRMRTSSIQFTGFDPGEAPRVDKYLNKDSKLSLGKHNIKVIQTPGHTPGSVSLYSRDDNLVIVGDLLFADGYIGRADFKYSDPALLNSSINRIKNLPPGTLAYPGHGDSFTPSNLKATGVNP